MNHPQLQDLVLLGGGHAHALLIAQWCMAPVAGVRLTLISPDALTPYSGMLPGLVAGHYSVDDTHIDLDRLCATAGFRFIRARATGLDLAAQQVLLADRPPLGFDLLSVNIGATPSLTVPGAHTYATPVKPISQFYPRWQAIKAQLALHPEARIGLVGGGAATVELACAMRAQAPKAHIAIYLEDHLPLTGYSQHFRARAHAELNRRRIDVHGNCRITQVDADQVRTDTRAFAVDHLFWCTQAAGPEWLQTTGLRLDAQGFILVNDRLQSVSHPRVFAAGDIASLLGQTRPKAGVFAVRQAPVLTHNLRALLLAQPLRRYRAQRAFLSLLSLGDGVALGTRAGGWLPTLAGRWVWRWKDRIDRRFMAMFTHLVPRQMAPGTAPNDALWGDQTPPPSAAAMRCGGCGAKVGAKVLAQVVHQLDTIERAEVRIGLNDPDDAAVLQWPTEAVLVQSVDQFRALVDDPFVQGQLAALHALSDVFAMRAEPHSAQALVTLPYAREALQVRDLTQLMAGALQVLNGAHCQLTGGHTSEGAELSMGFAVNGLARGPLLTKAGLCVGDHLILTKPLGTGCLFAARAQRATKGRWVHKALVHMLQSNGPAAELLARHGARACTDVTGFGLVGHLSEMLRASHLSARLQLNRLPALDGALACLAKGYVSSLQTQNLQARAAVKSASQWESDPRFALLFDPQTSGGLLAGVPANQVAPLLVALTAAGLQGVDIGVVTPVDDHLIALVDAER
ncbi:selenide, water dikinase SelD [Simiduia aestuariiviva]|uniref:Selenide,water dikinase n=1 Tax=Simiduia aestuariiviva TaxID=1510459 RepID=A0A839UM80_9GAMM|nr:selenide, water dikinase SelD [Simiduia aestuariiviva]MBB3166846.1 selenide,water dikinase [Simiduia aestuariiviva]